MRLLAIAAVATLITAGLTAAPAFARPGGHGHSGGHGVGHGAIHGGHHGGGNGWHGGHGGNGWHGGHRRCTWAWRHHHRVRRCW